MVRRGEHRTIVAGYPWFTDWGRDTFISLPGLALATGWTALARELLLALAPLVRDGLIPNRFPDGGDARVQHRRRAAVVRAGRAPLRRARRRRRRRWRGCCRRCAQIIDGYPRRHAPRHRRRRRRARARRGAGAAADLDGRQGRRLGGDAARTASRSRCRRCGWRRSRRPRGSSPPTIADYARELTERAAWARSSFAATFWDDERGWLYDVIDGQRRDATLRPNQLYALGLTAPLVDAERAERVLAVCERELVTPVGLRTRARGDGYRGRITGDQRARDAAYHEGTVWPFLLGIYADACQRVRGRVPPGLLDGLRAHLARRRARAARRDLRRQSAAPCRAAARRRRGASPRRCAC